MFGMIILGVVAGYVSSSILKNPKNNGQVELSTLLWEGAIIMVLN